MSIRLLKKQDIIRAGQRIEPFIRVTPVLWNEHIDKDFQRVIRFKCENLQRTGSFKLRGALNALSLLRSTGSCKNIATHSSGNHGAAVACAACEFDMDCTVIMPRTAPDVKQENIRSYGARIVFCEPTMEARLTATDDIIAQTGARLVHPFNDYAIMAGQGTAALELLQTCPDLDAIIVPVGGGGLLSGTATIAKALNPHITIYGVEPEKANDQQRSFRRRERVSIADPDTIADGLRTTCPGEKPFATILAYADNIVTVSEQTIRKAMRLIWDRLKIIVEPSGAVPLAALMESTTSITGRKIGIILSGGNLDLESWTW